MEILILSENDIKNLIDIHDAIEIVEEVFKLYATQNITLCAPSFLTIYNKNVVFAMPAYIMKKYKIFGVKWMCHFPENLQKYAIPTHIGIIILNDVNTGTPIAVLNANYLTAIRTGAVSAIGAKYLANINSEIIGIVGAGVEARSNLEALCSIFKIKKVKVISRSTESALLFAKEESSKLGIDIQTMKDVDDVIKGSDIIVLATPVRFPFVKNEYVKEGALVIDLGSYQQCSDEFIKKADKIVIDSLKSFFSIGIGSFADSVRRGVVSTQRIYAEIGEIIIGKKKGREHKHERILFTHSGIAALDMATAYEVYHRAKRKNIGYSIVI